jgi:hypothetical protein
MARQEIRGHCLCSSYTNVTGSDKPEGLLFNQF